MLYSGHFSFDEIGVDQTPRHGYFACLAKAENVEQAFEIFKKRILQIREEEKDELFTKGTSKNQYTILACFFDRLLRCVNTYITSYAHD